MRFQKCEFRKNWDFQYANIWIRCEFLPQREREMGSEIISYFTYIRPFIQLELKEIPILHALENNSKLLVRLDFNLFYRHIWIHGRGLLNGQ